MADKHTLLAAADSLDASGEFPGVSDVLRGIANVDYQWYMFRQNNSGGSFDYDPKAGISVEVWIEATSAKHANQRAEEIGIYSDGCSNGTDCSCCGDRWYEAYGPETEPVPAPESSYSGGSMKWMRDGGYEQFVHPIHGAFYGAGK